MSSSPLSRHVRFSLSLPLALLLPWAAGLSAQEIVPELTAVTERDDAPVDTRFHYSAPAAAGERSYEFAVIPRALRPGLDFAAFRQTRVAHADAALEGSIALPVFPDTRPEENGALSLVMRGPEAADWAAAFASPLTVSDLTHPGGGTRILRWTDDTVVAARLNDSLLGSSIITYQRMPTGALEARSRLEFSDSTAFTAAVNERVLVVSTREGVKSWVPGGVPFTWTPVAGIVPGAQGETARLFSDRLLVEGAAGNTIHRQDSFAPGGWRRTGGTPKMAVFATGEDFLILRDRFWLYLWERVAGTEEEWRETYRALPTVVGAFQVAATAPGMVALFGQQGLEVHERNPAGTWAKTTTLPAYASEVRENSLAIAGDWIAVGQGTTAPSPPAFPEEGTVHFFLRNTSDRTVWNAAGALTGPGHGYGLNLRWNGPELISSASQFGVQTRTTLRRLTGATAAVRDDDRTKPRILTTALKEPAGNAPETQRVTVALPLPAAEETALDFEITEGSARPGQDFTAASAGRLTIPAGGSRARIPVTVAADTLLENTEDFTLRLTPAGGAPVTGTIGILDSGPPAVLTGDATPLVEGYGSSTVTVRQTPAAGGSPPERAAEIGIFTGGFDSATEITPLTTRGVDLADQALTRTLSKSAPAASVTVTATQDTLAELGPGYNGDTGQDERVRGAFTGLETEREPGTLGLVFEGGVPAPPQTSDLLDWSLGGRWLFAAWGKINTATGRSSGGVACHVLPGGNGGDLAPAVQFLPWDGAYSAFRVITDGETLLTSAVRPEGESGATSLLRIHEPTGPADAPWRQVAEWSLFSTSPAGVTPRILSPRRIAWGNRLFEKAGAPGEWRVAAFGAEGRTVIDADGDWMLTRSGPDSPGILYLHRRTDPDLPVWTLVKTFRNSQDQEVNSLSTGRVRGRTLILEDTRGRIEFYRLSPGGVWEPEQLFANPDGAGVPGLRFAGESTLTLATGILSRTGPAAAPWVVTQTFGREMEGYGTAGSGRQDALGRMDTNVSPPRLSVLRPGVPLSVYDDDSLYFRLGSLNDSDAPAVEDHFQETVTQVSLLINRPPPFPMTVRVRTADEGSATAGLDYAPIDIQLPVGPRDPLTSRAARFTIRILSDRIPEPGETFLLVMDPPVVGVVQNTPPARVYIDDPRHQALLKPSAYEFTFLEPAEGGEPQAVEFLLETAQDRDMEFTVRPGEGATAYQGTDFTLPDGPLLLKAGETRLRVPLTILADALEEPVETFDLNLTATDPRLRTFTTGASVRIVSAAAGYGADSYAGTQGAALTADGQNGNPAGPGANDTVPTPATYFVDGQPSWGTVNMAPDGTFTAVPGPNVMGPVSFSVRVESIPALRFLDSTVVWKYLHPVDDINPSRANPAFPDTWHTPGFNDSAWATGSGTLSYGGFVPPASAGPGTVDLPAPPSGKRYTDYFRATFQSPAEMSMPLTLQLYLDDGAVIYINGVERGRAVSKGPQDSAYTFLRERDHYLLSTGISQTEEQEAIPQTADLGFVPLRAGANTLAISLHNSTQDSSDLGLRLASLETGAARPRAPVAIRFVDAHLPPLGKADAFTCPQNAVFLSGDHYGAGLLDNDGLYGPEGRPYDPILEITASPASVGTVELTGVAGNFTYTPPPDFVGEATFTYRIRDKDGLSEPVPVTLAVRPSQPYDLWKETALSAEAGSDADSDGDGYSNFMEYALGSDPADPLTDSGHGPLPEPGGALSVLVRRAPDLEWRLESAPAPDAAEWSTVMEGRGPNHRSVPPPCVTVSHVTEESLVLRVTPDTAASPKQFYRLRTTRIPPQR